jgi:hypothetical protein
MRVQRLPGFDRLERRCRCRRPVSWFRSNGTVECVRCRGLVDRGKRG